MLFITKLNFRPSIDITWQLLLVVRPPSRRKLRRVYYCIQTVLTHTKSISMLFLEQIDRTKCTRRGVWWKSEGSLATLDSRKPIKISFLVTLRAKQVRNQVSQNSNDIAGATLEAGNRSTTALSVNTKYVRMWRHPRRRKICWGKSGLWRLY